MTEMEGKSWCKLGGAMNSRRSTEHMGGRERDRAELCGREVQGAEVAGGDPPPPFPQPPGGGGASVSWQWIFG